MSQEIILVVDDKESERLLLDAHLRKWGFTPLLAQHGIEALELLKTNHVDLILSDLMMPFMDGMQLLREGIMAGYGTIPFIMMTASGSIDSAVASIKQGAANYILKPLNLEDLLTSIQHALSHVRLKKINLFPITLPPLRERKEDIPLLVEHFLYMNLMPFGRTESFESTLPTCQNFLCAFFYNVR